MSFLVEKISGTADDKFTCGVFSKHIDLAGGESGVLVSCVLVETPGLGEVENAGGFLHDGFENDTGKMSEGEGGILATLTAVRDGQVRRFEGMGAKANIALAFFYAGAVYVAKHGARIKTNVFRPPKSFEVAFGEGSGKVNGGDLVLICTDKFIETFDSNVFSEGVADDFSDVMDGLATDISALDDRSEIGAVFVRVGVGKWEEDPDTLGKEDKKPHEVSVEAIGEADSARVEVPVPPRVRTFSLFTYLIREVGRLRVGDIGAVFRLRRNIIIAAVLLILVLAASGFITMRNDKDADKTAEFRTHLQSANAKYSEALGLFDLNREKARALLIDAQGEVELAVALYPKDDEALALQSRIKDKISETVSLAGVDFRDFYEGRGKITAFSRGSGSFFAFGDDGVIELDDSGKKIKDLASLRSDGGYVWDNTVFSLSGDKIIKLKAGGVDGEVARAAGVRDIGVFLGNVYLLKGDQILKFVPIADGYAQSANYLDEPETFGDDSRFAIDGSIWVTNGKEVLKYTRGVSDGFNIEGISGIGELGEIYTNSDLDQIYVVDRSNSALIVFSKDGTYMKSYNSSEFAAASDLYVDEEAGKVYICVGNNILEAGL